MQLGGSSCSLSTAISLSATAVQASNGQSPLSRLSETPEGSDNPSTTTPKRYSGFFGFFLILALGSLMAMLVSRYMSYSRDCLMGDWIDIGACSVTCGGGTITQKRYVAHHDPRCAPDNSTDQTRQVACNTQRCPIPAGCCKVCDLACTRDTCKEIVDIDEGAVTCSLNAINGDGITWDSQVYGHPVQWQWRFSCPVVHCVDDRKRMVQLIDNKTLWSVEHGDYNITWHEATKRCLGDYALHLGLHVNTSGM